jgi:hypothetical protein
MKIFVDREIKVSDECDHSRSPLRLALSFNLKSTGRNGDHGHFFFVFRFFFGFLFSHSFK